VFEHVQPRAGDRAALQRGGQRRLVDDRAARGVD